MPATRRSSRDAADALIAVAPLVSRWTQRLLAGHDPPLTVAQFLALRAIAEGGMSGSELARQTGVSGPAVSQLLDGLSDAGLLARAELAEDRRRRALELTVDGQETLASARTMLRERLSGLLAELPHPEADALARALPEVEAVLSGAPPPKRPPPPRPPGPRRGPKH
jgi:DNA-binding MarR family transcriptional regulator